MHHHTRKKRNQNKTKGLKKSKNSLKSKSKNSRKVNKMTGGLASCKPGFRDFGKEKIPQAWDTANFTENEIIQSVKKLCDKFNSVLIQEVEITTYDTGKKETIKKYTELNVTDIESKLKSLGDFKYVSVSVALEEKFVFTDVVKYSNENSEDTRTNSKNISVDMCQLMKTVYYLIKKLKLQSIEDPFLDGDVLTHFVNIAPIPEIEKELHEAKINATKKALVDSGFLEKN